MSIELRFMALMLVLCGASAADLPLAEGFRSVRWGTPLAEIVTTWPKPLGRIRLDDTHSVYVIEPEFGLVLVHDCVRGLITGSVLSHKISECLGLPRAVLPGKRITGAVALSMPYHDFCVALGLPEGEPVFRHHDQLGSMELTSWFFYQQRQTAEHYILGGFMLVDPRFMTP